MVDRDVVRRGYDGLTETYAAKRAPVEREIDDGSARVLRSDGLLLLTEGTNDWRGANPDWLESGVEMQWRHVAGAETTREQLRQAGFAIRDE